DTLLGNASGDPHARGYRHCLRGSLRTRTVFPVAEALLVPTAQGYFKFNHLGRGICSGGDPRTPGCDHDVKLGDAKTLRSGSSDRVATGAAVHRSFPLDGPDILLVASRESSNRISLALS